MEKGWEQYHGWSRGRQSLLNTCPRGYYYQNVKSHELDWGDILRKTKKIVRLNMTNKQFLLGNIVHGAIDGLFDQVSSDREVTSVDSAIKYISRKITEINEKPEKFIIEVMNGKKISEDEILKIGEEAKRQVKIFFDEFFDFYKDLEIITHEDYCEITAEGYKMWVMPDLVTKSKKGKVCITEWKTDSNYSNAKDEEQMNKYILWATEVKKYSLDNLRAEFVFLDIGKSVAHEASQEEIDSLKETFVKKSKELLEDIKSRLEEDNFPKCDDIEICFNCGLKQYCDNN